MAGALEVTVERSKDQSLFKTCLSVNFASRFFEFCLVVKFDGMSNVFCQSSLDMKMSNRILNYPPNRPLQFGKQWKSVFGVFAYEVDDQEDVPKSKHFVLHNDDKQTSTPHSALICTDPVDILNKTVYCCALSAQGLSSCLFSVNNPLSSSSKLSERKFLLELREMHLIRLLLNAAMDCFMHSDDCVLSSCGSAIQRIVDLSDYSVAATASRLMMQTFAKDVSLFSFWSKSRSEAVTLKTLLYCIAPVSLQLVCQSKSFCSYVLNTNSSIDEYFQPSGWSGLTSAHHKWSMLMRLIDQFSLNKRIFWSSQCSSSLSQFTVFTNATNLLLQDSKVNRNFVKFVVHGHMLKSMAVSMLSPLTQQLFLLQQNKSCDDCDDFNLLSTRGVDELFIDANFGGSLDSLVSSVLRWSEVRVAALVQPSVNYEVRTMIKKLRGLLDSRDSSKFGSNFAFIPTCDSEVNQLQSLLALSEESSNHFARLVEPLLRDWAELNDDTVDASFWSNGFVRPKSGVPSAVSNRKDISRNLLPSTDGPTVESLQYVNETISSGISSSSGPAEQVEIPLIVGSAVVDQVDLDQALNKLKADYALKFLKVDTHRALLRWRTIKAQALRGARQELRRLMIEEQQQLQDLSRLKVENPDVFHEKLEHSLLEEKKRLLLFQLQVIHRQSDKEHQSETNAVDQPVEVAQKDLNYDIVNAEVWPSGGVSAAQGHDEKMSENAYESTANEDEIDVDGLQISNLVVDSPSDVPVVSDTASYQPEVPQSSHNSQDPLKDTETVATGAFSALASKTPVVTVRSKESGSSQTEVKLPSSSFLDVSQPLLCPDLSWIASEEQMMQDTLSDFNKSLRLLAQHSNLVESYNDSGDDQHLPLKPGSKFLYGPDVTSSEGPLLRCIKGQCHALNMAALHSVIAVSGVLDQLKAVENMCLLSPQSDFISRLCSHMMESTSALTPAQIDRRQEKMTSVWNEETLRISLDVCLGKEQWQAQTLAWRGLGCTFELRDETTSDSMKGYSRQRCHLLPVWLCAEDGVTRLRFSRNNVSQTGENKLFVSKLVFSDSVLDGICCMTIRCLEVCQLQELLRMVWLKMKSDRQPMKSTSVRFKGADQNSLISGAATAGSHSQSQASLYRSGLLVVQHLVRGITAYLTERITDARSSLRMSLMRDIVDCERARGGLETLVTAVKDFAVQLRVSALLDDDQFTDNGTISDCNREVCDNLSLLLRDCRLLLGCLLVDDLSMFTSYYADLQVRVEALRSRIEACCFELTSAHLTSLLANL